MKHIAFAVTVLAGLSLPWGLAAQDRVEVAAPETVEAGAGVVGGVKAPLETKPLTGR